MIEGKKKMLKDIDGLKKKKISFAQSLLVFLVIMIGVAFVSLIYDFPMFFTISAFLFAATITTFIHDNWVLNSLVVPVTPVVFMASLNDVYMMIHNISWDPAGNLSGLGSFVFHFTTFLICIYVFGARRNTSLLVMLAATVLYPTWMLLVQNFLISGYVLNFFGSSAGQGEVFFWSIITGILFSAITTFKNSRSKKAIEKCNGGWCPF